MNAALRRLLWPESVAIIGASPTGQWTRHMIPSLRQLGYRGRIFPINPQYEEVARVRCYPSVRDLPEHPDAALLVVRRDVAVSALEECAAWGVGGAVVLAGGFAEAGPQGRALQERLCEIARRAGMAVLGPNCQGYINCLQPSALWMDEIFEPLHPGGVAIVSHSGTVSTGIMNHLYRRGIYPSFVLSVGNEAVLTAADLIDALVDDRDTRVIAAYLETIRDPQRFFAACDRAAEADKPVIVLKVGRTPAAREVISAHTAALAGPDRIIDALLRVHRVVRVQSLEEMVETCVAFSGRRITAPRLAAFAASGGHIELVVDAVASTPLSFSPFRPETAAKLSAQLPPYVPGVAKNPFDTGGARLEALETIVEDSGIDGVLFITQTRRYPTGVMDLLMATLEMAEKLHDTSDKPVIVLSVNSDVEPSVSLRLASRGIAVLAGIDAGLRALGHACRYAQPAPAPVAPPDLDAEALRRRLGRLRAPLVGLDALNLLAAVGVATVRSVEATSAGDAVAAARALGYPVVVKTGARQVLHKSEAGQVFLNLTSVEAVRRAARAVRPPILVQPQVTGGVELIVGLESDPDLGACVAVGMGGVLAELLDMVAIRAVPLRSGEAAEMLTELPVHPIFDGYRGQPPVDRAAIAATIERIAAFGAAAGPTIRSVDLNPVIASSAGVHVVDARVIPRNVGAPPDGGAG